MKNINRHYKICKIISYPVIFFLISFSLISCDKAVEPKDDQNSTKNLLAFTAVFYDNKNDSYTAKLVITDFYNPNNYTILTNTKLVEVGPVFSEDKSKIIFGILGPADGGPQLALYDLQTNQLELLEGYESDSYVYGSHVVWNPNGTGFYFRGPYYSPHVYFYNFSDKLINIIRRNVMPIAIKDSETLIVYGHNPETDQLIDYFMMDINGNYISKIDNPYIEYINRNGVVKKDAHSLDYNSTLNQLVFSSRDSTVQGYKIAVTDFTGNYYKEYTKGDYIDEHPKWGPDGTILFDRRIINDNSTGAETKIMEINTETDEVTEFLNPNVISGAIALRYPDF